MILKQTFVNKSRDGERESVSNFGQEELLRIAPVACDTPPLRLAVHPLLTRHLSLHEVHKLEIAFA